FFLKNIFYLYRSVHFSGACGELFVWTQQICIISNTSIEIANRLAKMNLDKTFFVFKKEIHTTIKVALIYCFDFGLLSASLYLAKLAHYVYRVEIEIQEMDDKLAEYFSCAVLA
ncbi:hypothetical protein ACJX0J_019408, partial [Zea mays]